MLLKVYCRVLAALKSDRGEGPVPYIIMVALMTLAALAVAGAVSGVAGDWIDKLNSDAETP